MSDRYFYRQHLPDETFGHYKPRTDSSSVKKRKDVKPRYERKLPETKYQTHSIPDCNNFHQPVNVNGHLFFDIECSRDVLTWCDVCTGLIWPMHGSTCARCKYCKLTCHYRCLSLLKQQTNLRCTVCVSPSSSNSSSSTKSWSARSKAIKNTETIRLQFDSSAVLKNAIKNFNSTVDDRFKMDLNDDGITFIGYVRVAVRLQRPVNILKVGKNNDRLTKEMMQFEKFTKRLHLTSQTTCQDVVEALVKRYNIQDCLRKFALYERKQKTKEHY